MLENFSNIIQQLPATLADAGQVFWMNALISIFFALLLTIGIYIHEQNSLTDRQKSDAFPIHLISLSVALTFLTILILGGFSAVVSEKIKTEIAQSEKIRAVSLDYLRKDKILSNTMSLFVLSGDPKWGEAYLSLYSEQQSTLNMLKEALVDLEVGEFKSFDTSEELRSRMDREILNLAGNGKRSEASLYIQSHDYQVAKEDYEKNLDILINNFADPAHVNLKSLADKDDKIFLLSLLSGAALGVFWFFSFRSIRRWQREILEIRNNLSQKIAEKEVLEEKMVSYVKDVRLARDRALLAMRSADQANEAKTEFLTNMSHELRTPMNSILGLTELLLKNEKTLPEQKELLSVILEAGESLLKIVNDVLDIAKIEAQGITLQNKAFQLHDVISKVTNTLKPMAFEKHLVFKEDIEGDTVVLMGDEIRVTRIFTNLLANAIKYTDQGSITFFLRVTPDVNGEVLVSAEVSDTGIGIAEDKLEQVFERFSQADNSSTRKYGGTGLGLSIAKELVELMGGEIGVDSTLGEGSRFWIDIPFAISELPVHGKAQQRPLRVRSFELSGRAELDKAHILLAEDHPLNQVFMETLLKEMGFVHITTAGNGHEVLEALANEHHDVVLMDCFMPEMNGYEATKAIRESEKRDGAHLPIVAMTARAMVGDREECLAAGMDDYISKPIDMESLRKILSRWIVMSPAS